MKIRGPQSQPPVHKPSSPEVVSTNHSPSSTITKNSALGHTDKFQTMLHHQKGTGTVSVSLVGNVDIPKDWGEVTPEDRQATVKALQNLAHDLRDKGVPGVEIWGKLKTEAVARYADKQVDPARKADFVMQDVALVTVGKDALKYLKQYEGLPRLGKADTLVQKFQEDWQAMGVPPADDNWEKAGWAGSNLDSHTGKDFRPEINDKTKNQIYHTMFYEFLTYVTQDPLLVRAGSMVHEVRDGTADGGISDEDHNASYVGAAVGKSLRESRDGAHTEKDMKHWGDLTLAAYGKAGGPEVRAGKASPEAMAMHHKITHMLNNKGLMWNTENLLIQGVDSMNEGLKKGSELLEKTQQRLKDIF